MRKEDSVEMRRKEEEKLIKKEDIDVGIKESEWGGTRERVNENID